MGFILVWVQSEFTGTFGIQIENIWFLLPKMGFMTGDVFAWHLVRPWVQYLLITKTMCLLCRTTSAVEKDQEQIWGKAKTRGHVGWNRLLDQSRVGQWMSICHIWEIHYKQSHEISLVHLSVSNTKLLARTDSGREKCLSLFWLMHATPALRKLNQDCWEFEASTGYVVSVAWKPDKNK